jgi:hypothetical protein
MQHGHSARKTPTYKSWLKMRERCKSTTCNRVDSYYNKGISYDPRWDSFELFLEDMGERPEGMSLDRINNDKGYSKDNCRWASSFEQARNTSRNVFYQIDEKLYCQSEAFEKLGVTIKILRNMRAKNKFPNNVKFVGQINKQEYVS